MVKISDIPKYEGKEITLKGWITNKRSSKGIEFLNFRDGSGFVQLVVDVNEAGEDIYKKAHHLSVESAIELKGKVIKDEKQFGGYEIHVTDLKIIFKTENYPIGNKAHGPDFLLDNRHLTLRGRRFWAIMKVRNNIIYALHNFFQKEGFLKADTPILTPNAAEGTTNLFTVDYYGDDAYLAQTGQLYGEAMALAFGKIYTLGPTFRAEKSKTRRHLSEFWMLEPEMAFFDNDMNMDLIEKMIKEVIAEVLQKSKLELQILERDTSILEKTIKEPFPRITYDEAVEILHGNKKINGVSSIDLINNEIEKVKNEVEKIKNEIQDREKILKDPSLKKGKRNFIQNKVDTLKNNLKQLQEKLQYLPQWLESAKNFPYGDDFGGSDETVLTWLFDLPIMVYNWPAEIKAFYMKRVEGNPNLVKGVDVLAPEGYGEIVGGSERETDLNVLIERIKKENLPQEIFEWYLDLRRYGSVPHSGFGLGIERFVAWITKTKHIREVIPFPRYYGRLEP